MASLKKMKFVFTVHNPLSKDAFGVNRFSLWAEKLTYRKKQTVIGVSREVLHDYDTWVGIKGKSFVLYDYVHDKFFDLQYASCRDISSGLKLIAVGNLRRQKNYATLLDAFLLLRDLPVSVDIYGGGDMEHELARKIKNEQLNVRLMGRVSDVSKVLPAYHAYIMPSLFEGFGIAPMEAMAAGMPVILSDLPVFREVAENIPIYFDPGNARSIAEAIKYVYDNWSDVNVKGLRGRAIIKQKASREVYLSKLVEIYES
jgi:glycosyltransferase involved in cell wall biosynthesis